MPRPGLPPTPASSTDIAGKHNGALPQIESAFALPPAALAPGHQNSHGASRGSTSSSTASSNHSDASYRPMSPSSPDATPRKRSSAAFQGERTVEDFALPPPPTRSRKIIQMKPRAQDEKPAPQVFRAADQSEPHGGVVATNKTTTQNAGGKKKQGAGNTAAGRKIARKTAHSLIERRRRSKMNEEFGVLKDMIPACAGQDMHKLAILQASIEYLRYLEKCVSDLQAVNRSPHRGDQQKLTSSSPSCYPTSAQNEEGDEDEGMSDDPGSGASTPSAQTNNIVATAEPPPSAHQSPRTVSTRQPNSTVRPTLPSISPILSNASSTNASPAIHPSDHQQPYHGSRHYSLSSYTTNTSSGYLNSALLSPAFESLANQRRFGSSGSLAEFRLASPALRPQSDVAVPEKRGRTSSPSSPANIHLEGNSILSDKRRPSTGVSPPEAVVLAKPVPAAQARPGERVRGEHDGDTDMDQQATAALLMLNADRRSWDAEENRGMSVRDLLRD